MLFFHSIVSHYAKQMLPKTRCCKYRISKAVCLSCWCSIQYIFGFAFTSPQQYSRDSSWQSLCLTGLYKRHLRLKWTFRELFWTKSESDITTFPREVMQHFCTSTLHLPTHPFPRHIHSSPLKVSEELLSWVLFVTDPHSTKRMVLNKNSMWCKCVSKHRHINNATFWPTKWIAIYSTSLSADKGRGFSFNH